MKDPSLSEPQRDPWETQAKHLKNNVNEANQLRVIPQEIAATIEKHGLPALHDIYKTMKNECKYTLAEFLCLEVDGQGLGGHQRVKLAEQAVRDMLIAHGVKQVLEWLKACKGGSGAATSTAAERTAGRRNMAYEVITMAKRLVMNKSQKVTHEGEDVSGTVIELGPEGDDYMHAFHTMPLPSGLA
eukprot:COSAG06_NODE_473_length_15308_cov_162.912952_5_plen_186_part_00